MAGFAGAAVAIDVWCHQKLNPKEKYGALSPYPNEDALISFTKKRLDSAGKLFKIGKSREEKKKRYSFLFFF